MLSAGLPLRGVIAQGCSKTCSEKQSKRKVANECIWEAGILTWMHRAGRRLGAIALLAMLVRAIVPAGYMLATAETAQGRYLTITVCEAHGAPAQVLDLKTGRLVDPSRVPLGPTERTEHAPCVFAAAAPLAPPVGSVEPIVFALSFAAPIAPPCDVRPGEGIPAPPPPSTGPPLPTELS